LQTHSFPTRRSSDLNLSYPESPKGFADWQKRLVRELAETVARFKPLDTAN